MARPATGPAIAGRWKRLISAKARGCPTLADSFTHGELMRYYERVQAEKNGLQAFDYDIESWTYSGKRPNFMIFDPQKLITGMER